MNTNQSISIACAVYVIAINVLVNSYLAKRFILFNTQRSMIDMNHLGVGSHPICNLGLLTNYALAGMFIVQGTMSNDKLYAYRKVFLSVLMLFVVLQVGMNSYLASLATSHNFAQSRVSILRAMNSTPACGPCSNEISFELPTPRIGLAEYMIPVYIAQLYMLNQIEN